MQSKSLEQIYRRKNLLLRSLSWHRYITSRWLNMAGASTKNYYQVLEVEKNCTPAEIKESFIRLSKEIHPDKNHDSPDLHHKFVLLNEAYSVLSKPHERQAYDAKLAIKENPRIHHYNGVTTDAPRERVIFKDETLWEMRDRSEDKRYENRSYYGVPGIKKRLPNSYIAFGAIVFMVIGGIFHFFVAKASSSFAIAQLDERDRKASLDYKMVREQALANGNEMQLQLLRRKSEELEMKRKQAL